MGIIWLHEVLRAFPEMQGPQQGRGLKRGIVSMTLEIHEQTLWLIPVGLAVSFMVWVLLNWWQEERRPKDGSRDYSSGAEGFQYRSSGRAQVRQSDSPFTIENRPKFTPSPQR